MNRFVITLVTWVVALLTIAIFPALSASTEKVTAAASWTAPIDTAGDNPQLAPERDKLVARARQVAGRLIVKRMRRVACVSHNLRRIKFGWKH